MTNDTTTDDTGMDDSVDELDPTDVEQLVLEDSKLSETIEHLTQRRGQIRATVARHFDVGTHQVGDRQVVVTQPGRLDASRFAADHPVERFPSLYKPVLSTDAVRDEFSAAQLRDEYTTLGAKQVRIR